MFLEIRVLQKVISLQKKSELVKSVSRLNEIRFATVSRLNVRGFATVSRLNVTRFATVSRLNVIGFARGDGGN